MSPQIAGRGLEQDIQRKKGGGSNEEGTVEGFSLSDGRKRGGWELVFEEGGRREYVRFGMEEGG